MYLSDALILEKAHRLCAELYRVHHLWFFGSQFSSRWLYVFKKRHAFKIHTCHGKSADTNVKGATLQVPLLCAMVQLYGEEHLYIAYEFGLCPNRVKNRTISPASLKRRKQDKVGTPFLLCMNATGAFQFLFCN